MLDLTINIGNTFVPKKNIGNTSYTTHKITSPHNFGETHEIKCSTACSLKIKKCTIVPSCARNKI